MGQRNNCLKTGESGGKFAFDLHNIFKQTHLHELKRLEEIRFVRTPFVVLFVVLSVQIRPSFQKVSAFCHEVSEVAPRHPNVVPHDVFLVLCELKPQAV